MNTWLNMKDNKVVIYEWYKNYKGGTNNLHCTLIQTTGGHVIKKFSSTKNKALSYAKQYIRKNNLTLHSEKTRSIL